MCSPTVRGESSHEFQSRSSYKRTIEYFNSFKITILTSADFTSFRCLDVLLLCTTFTLVKISHSLNEFLRRREKQHNARRNRVRRDKRSDLNRDNMWIMNIIFLLKITKMLLIHAAENETQQSKRKINNFLAEV